MTGQQQMTIPAGQWRMVRGARRTTYPQLRHDVTVTVAEVRPLDEDVTLIIATNGERYIIRKD